MNFNSKSIKPYSIHWGYTTILYDEFPYFDLKRFFIKIDFYNGDEYTRYINNHKLDSLKFTSSSQIIKINSVNYFWTMILKNKTDKIKITFNDELEAMNWSSDDMNKIEAQKLLDKNINYLKSKNMIYLNEFQ